MAERDLRSLLDRIEAIRNPCDLDLLLFFHRRPRALLTSEMIVTYLGFDHQQIAQSLENLIAAGLLSRSVNEAHAARMYTLRLDGALGGQLAEFMKIASTRQGRLDLRKLLESGPAEAPSAGMKRSVA